MQYHVCIKQVPDVAAPASSGQMVLNAYDASALEASLVLREKYGGSIAVVSIGSSRVKETVLRALAMGADSATHLEVAEDAGLDSFAYASILRDHFQNSVYNVILCGKQAQDTDAGLTGPMLAELLDLPYATNAVGLDFQDTKIVVNRQSDSSQELITLDVPCLITCSNDMNDPRIPSLRGTMSARKKPLETVSISTLPSPCTHLLELKPMPKRPKGEMIEGDRLEDQVVTLVDRLHNSDKVF